MKICIVGWYGTETIGDRAIIAGLYSFFNEAFTNYEINLGSLYPFYSERMIREDSKLYKLINGKEININLFNSKDKKALEKNIISSDFVIMGGGPIMHIDELFMIEYAFKFAKKKNKKTGIIGCGIGPLFTKDHKKSAINIVNYSDVVILRDEKSKVYLDKIAKEEKLQVDLSKVNISFDPAVKCAIEYKKRASNNINDEIIVNLREFPSEYSEKCDKDIINSNINEFVTSIAEKYCENTIRLTPMHYFKIGNDDREFLNRIKLQNNKKNILVQNKVLSLAETMDLFINAKFNIGMRFHSVVLQTILSGKNYVLDYTEPNIGKISGFLSDIDKQAFYKDRFVSLQEDNIIDIEMFNNKSNNDKFTYNEVYVNDRLNIYIKELKKIL